MEDKVNDAAAASRVAEKGESPKDMKKKIARGGGDKSQTGVHDDELDLHNLIIDGDEEDLRSKKDALRRHYNILRTGDEPDRVQSARVFAELLFKHHYTGQYTDIYDVVSSSQIWGAAKNMVDIEMDLATRSAGWGLLAAMTPGLSPSDIKKTERLMQHPDLDSFHAHHMALRARWKVAPLHTLAIAISWILPAYDALASQRRSPSSLLRSPTEQEFYSLLDLIVIRISNETRKDPARAFEFTVVLSISLEAIILRPDATQNDTLVCMDMMMRIPGIRGIPESDFEAHILSLLFVYCRGPSPAKTASGRLIDTFLRHPLSENPATDAVIWKLRLFLKPSQDDIVGVCEVLKLLSRLVLERRRPVLSTSRLDDIFHMLHRQSWWIKDEPELLSHALSFSNAVLQLGLDLGPLGSLDIQTTTLSTLLDTVLSLSDGIREPSSTGLEARRSNTARGPNDTVQDIVEIVQVLKSACEAHDAHRAEVYNLFLSRACRNVAWQDSQDWTPPKLAPVDVVNLPRSKPSEIARKPLDVTSQSTRPRIAQNSEERLAQLKSLRVTREASSTSVESGSLGTTQEDPETFLQPKSSEITQGRSETAPQTEQSDITLENDQALVLCDPPVLPPPAYTGDQGRMRALVEGLVFGWSGIGRGRLDAVAISDPSAPPPPAHIQYQGPMRTMVVLHLIYLLAALLLLVDPSTGKMTVALTWKTALSGILLATTLSDHILWGTLARGTSIMFAKLTKTAVSLATEPFVKPGHQRITWICGCGKRMYADILETDPGEATRLEADLRRCAAAATGNTSPSRSPSPNDGETSGFGFSQPRGSPDISDTPSPAEASISASQDGVQETTSQPVAPEKRFLLVCVNGSRMLRLEQLDLIPYTNDQVLFQDIRKAYIDAKKNHVRRFHPDTPKPVMKLVLKLDWCFAELQRYLVLILTRLRLNWLVWWVGDNLFYVPNSATFVRFELVPVKGEFAPEILESRCLPPLEEVQKRRYHYHPCPAENGRLLPALRIPYLHVFFEPGVHLDDFWTNRTPKKLRNRLAYAPREGQAEDQPSPAIGWGVHIVEGPNWSAFSVLSWLFYGANMVLAVVYGAVMGDVSGAVELATYSVGVLTIAITCVAVVAQRHANSGS